MSGSIAEIHGIIQQGIQQIEEVTSPSTEAHEAMNEGNDHIQLAVEGIATVLGHLSRAKDAYSKSATECRASVSPMRDSAESFVEAGANEDEAMSRVVEVLKNTRKATRTIAGSLDGAATYLTESIGILENHRDTFERMVPGITKNNEFIEQNATKLAPAVVQEAQNWQNRF